ncbi:S41 family peptidase [uncultured Winogradskyella sp.]|uniref:S41 family peptidase n=1 Tax=uncultured Winogradskyella sp. TaxID=395353 RepID=UPI00260F9AEF|nr:S41 family peptidase [uncultured Winogradskyella sp.]
MKKIKTLLLACVLLLSVTSCFEDFDDNFIVASTSEINDFVWKGMNVNYLYKSEIPNLANDRFTSNEEYTEYLNDFDAPEDLFESLKYLPESVDLFSRIYSNYFDLLNAQQGTSLSNGIEFNLYFVPGSETEVFGAITLVLNNSVADNLGLERGQIFRAVNNEELTTDNITDLLTTDSYTLNFADYNNNGTSEPEDDTITLNGESAELTKVTYTENPVHKVEVINLTPSIKIGYLMYNRFNSSFNSELNAAFGEFNAAGISDLVIDLRYNGGGSIQTAAYLGSMITGQFTGEVYSKTFYNEDLQNLNTDYLFTNTIEGGGAINSLNLSKVYVLTTNRRTASASELLINSLKPYIEVIVVGENTVGKTQASLTRYDSPNFAFENVNPSHTYALQPLVANSTNVNDQLVPNSGLIPDIQITESPSTFGTLGDLNEPLLATAIVDILSADRPLNRFNQNFTLFKINKTQPLEQDMYID